MNNIKERLKDILYNDIQEELETRESFGILSVDGLWFATMELDEECRYKIEDENKEFIDKQIKSVNNIRNEIENQMEKLGISIKELNQIEPLSTIQQPGWEDLEFDLDSIIYELESYEPVETIGMKGEGEATIEVEYQDHNNVDYIDDFLVKFEYKLEGNESYYVVIKNITAK